MVKPRGGLPRTDLISNLTLPESRDSKRVPDGGHVELDHFDGEDESGARKMLRGPLPAMVPDAFLLEGSESRSTESVSLLPETAAFFELRAFEARLIVDFLKTHLQGSDFRKKDRQALSDYDILVLASILVSRFDSPEGFVKRNAPDSPVTMEWTSEPSGKRKVVLYGQSLGQGSYKKARQRRVLRYDPATGELRLGKATAHIREARDERPVLDADFDAVLRELQAKGVDTNTDFRIAGNIKGYRLRKGRAEGHEEAFPGDLRSVAPLLTPAGRLRILSDVAKTLSKFHQGHYVHGDVKPTNILVKDEGSGARGYLSDFDSLGKEGEALGISSGRYLYPLAVLTQDKSDLNDIYALAQTFEDVMGSDVPEGAEQVCALAEIILQGGLPATMRSFLAQLAAL